MIPARRVCVEQSITNGRGHIEIFIDVPTVERDRECTAPRFRSPLRTDLTSQPDMLACFYQRQPSRPNCKPAFGTRRAGQFSRTTFVADVNSTILACTQRDLSMRRIAAVTAQIRVGLTSFRRASDANQCPIYVAARLGRRKFGRKLRQFQGEATEKGRHFTPAGRDGAKWSSPPPTGGI